MLECRYSCNARRVRSLSHGEVYLSSASEDRLDGGDVTERPTTKVANLYDLELVSRVVFMSKMAVNFIRFVVWQLRLPWRRRKLLGLCDGFSPPRFAKNSPKMLYAHEQPTESRKCLS